MEAHYIKKVVTIETNKGKVEGKGQKMNSKDSSRLIRNYKKREDSVKESNQIFEEFRGVFLNCVQNRFSTANPIVRNYVEVKNRFLANLAQTNQQLFDDRGVLNMQDDINVYKDKLFESRIGNISEIQGADPRNNSNIFTSHLVTQERFSQSNVIKSVEPSWQVPVAREIHGMDFKKKLVDPMGKENPLEPNRVSSRNDSLIMKDDDRQALIDDDPFDFKAFDVVKKPAVTIQSPMKLQQNASPVINFKSKTTGFKPQEQKPHDLSAALNMPKEEQHNNKSKFDFDFGSFQPIVQTPNPTPPQQEEFKVPPMQSVRRIETEIVQAPQIQQPIYVVPQPTLEYDQPDEPNYAQQTNTYTRGDFQGNHVTQEQPHTYGQFEQADNYQDQPYNDPNPNESRQAYPNMQGGVGQQQHYQIEVDKNVSSDEEYTYY